MKIADLPNPADHPLSSARFPNRFPTFSSQSLSPFDRHFLPSFPQNNSSIHPFVLRQNSKFTDSSIPQILQFTDITDSQLVSAVPSFTDLPTLQIPDLPTDRKFPTFRLRRFLTIYLATMNFTFQKIILSNSKIQI